MSILTTHYPSDVILSRPDGWLEQGKNTYYTIRLHLLLERHQAENKTCIGEILNAFHGPGKIEVKDTVEGELSIINLSETVASQIVSEEMISGITAELLAGLQTPFYHVTPGISTSIQSRLSRTAQTTSTGRTTVEQRVAHKFEVTHSFETQTDEDFYAVAVYKPMLCDVYLHYIDYLFVEYRASLFGLRKKKINLPRPVANQHVNRINVSKPLFSLRYWEQLPRSSQIYSQEKYALQPDKVYFPDTVSVEPLRKPVQLYLPEWPERPTLYTLSNIAFPYRWIDRKGEWTAEELKQIEIDEAEGSLWWFQHGPGRQP